MSSQWKLILIAALILVVGGMFYANHKVINNKPIENSAATTSPVNTDEISWIYDLNDALAASARDGKPVFADVYTDWCGWCKKLDSDVYTDKRMIELSADFICVKIDGDKYKDIVQKYKVNGYPTLLFLDDKGKVIGQVPGYIEADELLNVMNKVKRAYK